jgi:hypothetical protein
VLIGNLNIGHSSRSQMTSQEERISGVALLQSRVTRAWKLAIVARSFRYGEHGAWDEVRVIRATEFEIRTRRPRSINADGEIVTRTPSPVQRRAARNRGFCAEGSLTRHLIQPLLLVGLERCTAMAGEKDQLLESRTLPSRDRRAEIAILINY